MSQKNHKHGGSHNPPQKGKAPQGKAGQAKASQKNQQPAPQKSKAGLIAGLAIVILIAGIVVVATNGKGGAGGGTTGAGAPQPTAEEARYIGRLLPASFEETSVAPPQTYTSAVQMAELTPVQTETQISIPVADVVNAKIALIQYKKPDGSSLPLMTYVKPSGKLFVGVSFCPPCQGQWQTIQPDGTLTCNSCGTKRDLETMVGLSGACKLYPVDELPATIVNGSIVLDNAAIDAWSPQPLDRKVG